MNRILVIFLFISLALAGYQDVVDVKAQGEMTMQTEMTSISSADTKLNSRFIRENKELTSFYTGNVEYVQTLCRISQESENAQSSSEQARFIQKLISNSLLKDYNIKQHISEQLSTFQTIVQSTLHCHSAHLIFLLRKIVI